MFKIPIETPAKLRKIPITPPAQLAWFALLMERKRIPAIR